MGFDSSRSLVARLDAVQSGAATGAAATLLRGMLQVASGGFVVGRWLHRNLYETGLRARRRLPHPVVSVGNLTAGGAGKTPLVAWLARSLLARGVQPAVLARGYGRAPGDPLNEEGRWLAETVPGLPVLQGADRVATARQFLRAHTCDLFLLDDGFQHERLRRDLDLVLVDGLRPFGHGHRLPRGLLRDPPSALRRADRIVVTRAEHLDGSARSELGDRLEELAPGVPVAWAKFEVREVRIGDDLEPATMLQERRVLLATAVGHPASVRRTVESLGAAVVDEQLYPDHHDFTAQEAGVLVSRAKALDAVVVVTEKDHVKLRELWPPTAAAPWVFRQTVDVGGGEVLVERVCALSQRSPDDAGTLRSSSSS